MTYTDDDVIIHKASGLLVPAHFAHFERRVEMGRKKYGTLHIITDQRVMRQEAIDELADAVYYLCAESENSSGPAKRAAEEALALVIKAWETIDGMRVFETEPTVEGED
jgi:hypothetical protein